MPLLKGFELPDFLLNQIEQMVTALSDQQILLYVQAVPDWLGGFRIIKKNCARFRKIIIKKMVAGSQEMPEELLKLLSLNKVNCDLLPNLSVESLESFHADFLSAFGPEYYILCLFIDDRSEVNELAIEFVENYKVICEETAECDDHEDLEPSGSAIEKELEKELETLKNKQNTFKQDVAKKQKKIKALQNIIDNLKSQKKELNKKYAQEKDKVRGISSQLDLKQQEIDQLNRIAEEKIQAGINEKIDLFRKSWLAEPISVNEIIAENSANLLEKAEQILAGQARQDRHYGNLQILKNRLETFQQTKKDIDYARKNALTPLPELAYVSQELDLEIRKLSNLINLKSNRNSLIEDLQIRINEASSRSSLQQIAELLPQLHELKLFTSRNYDCLRNNIARTQDRLINSNKELLHNFIDNRPTEKEVELIIVDGHNVILGNESCFLFNDNKINSSGHAGRQLLTELIIKEFCHDSQIFVRIFFDSPVYSENKLTENITEIFSGGGQDDQRADKAIIQYIKGNKNNSANRFILVTDDRKLAAAAEKLKVRICPVAEFCLKIKAQGQG